jgi:hypothetical protein
MMIIQFNSYLFACQLNGPRANYKVSTSERKETNTIYKVQNKGKNNNNNNKIKVII